MFFLSPWLTLCKRPQGDSLISVLSQVFRMFWQSSRCTRVECTAGSNTRRIKQLEEDMLNHGVLEFSCPIVAMFPHCRDRNIQKVQSGAVTGSRHGAAFLRVGRSRGWPPCHQLWDGRRQAWLQAQLQQRLLRRQRDGFPRVWGKHDAPNEGLNWWLSLAACTKRSALQPCPCSPHSPCKASRAAAPPASQE